MTFEFQTGKLLAEICENGILEEGGIDGISEGEWGSGRMDGCAIPSDQERSVALRRDRRSGGGFGGLGGLPAGHLEGPLTAILFPLIVNK